MQLMVSFLVMHISLKLISALSVSKSCKFNET